MERMGGDDESTPTSPVFQRYHNESPLEKNAGLGYDETNTIRSRIEERMKCRKQNGLGIGLPFSHHLVSALEGDLRCESEEGTGTKFWFVVPIDLSHDNIKSVKNGRLMQNEIVAQSSDGSPVVDAVKKKDSLPSIANKVDGPIKRAKKRHRIEQEQQASNFVEDIETSTKIPQECEIFSSGFKAKTLPLVLVVEDSDVCAKVLCMHIRKLKCSTFRAENGQVALDILREAIPGMYDLVLMDLRMPVMDGLEATRRIKTDPRLKGLPVVALTGEVGLKTKEECDEIKFDGFCAKPMKRAALVNILETHCFHTTA